MGRRILIADDDSDFASALSLRLQGAGYQTSTVGEGIRVMEQIRKDPPDLVILDIQLPVGGGIDVLKRIKKYQETRNIPVIILTGTHPEREKDCLELGALAFFVKPYDPVDFLARVQAILT